MFRKSESYFISFLPVNTTVELVICEIIIIIIIQFATF